VETTTTTAPPETTTTTAAPTTTTSTVPGRKFLFTRKYRGLLRLYICSIWKCPA
jgi:hypothetical protein